MAAIGQLGGGNPDPKTSHVWSRGARDLYQRARKAIACYGRRWLHEAGHGSFKAQMGGSIMAVKPCSMAKEMARKAVLYSRLQVVGAEAAASA